MDEMKYGFGRIAERLLLGNNLGSYLHVYSLGDLVTGLAQSTRIDLYI